MKTEIKIHPDLTKQIAKEFSVTTECVRNALKNKTVSQLSETIRQRAKQLLKKEVNKIN